MVHSDGHQQIIASGSAHFLSAPDIVIAGDTASAVGYSLLVRASTEAHAPTSATAGGFYVDRLSANRWELHRTDAGWKVTNRVNYLINGQQAARGLLAEPTIKRGQGPAL